MIDLSKNELVCRKKEAEARNKIHLVLTDKGENLRERLME